MKKNLKNAHIAHIVLNKENFEAAIELADKIFTSTTNPSVASVSAVRAQTQSADETLPAIPYAQQEVAAIRGSGRGRGRGRRGRGGRSNRGGAGAGGATGTQTASQPRHKGTKHPDLPNGEWRGCQMHFRWGKSAFFCSEPSSCPWKDIYIPKPAKN